MSETKIDDGGQAFPMHDRDDALRGMSLRDYFAAKAMQAMIGRGEDHGLVAAEAAYRFADCMLAARKQVQP